MVPAPDLAAVRFLGADVEPLEAILARTAAFDRVYRDPPTDGWPDPPPLQSVLDFLPVKPVFEGPDGRRYTPRVSALGTDLVPTDAGPAAKVSDAVRDGLFLPGVGPPSANDVTIAAVLDAIRRAADAGGGAPSFAERLAESAAKGILKDIGSKALREVFSGGGVGGLLGQLGGIGAADITRSLLQNVTSSLVGMGMSAAFNAVWAVDDESSAAEHVAHEYAFQGLTSYLSNGGDLAKMAAKYMPAKPVPAMAAVRVGDVEDKGNAVLPPGSPNVFVEGQAAARDGDPVDKTGKKLSFGSTTVNVNGLTATRILDTVSLAPGKFPKAAARTSIGGTTNKPAPPLPPALPGGGGGKPAPAPAAKQEGDPKFYPWQTVGISADDLTHLLGMVANLPVAMMLRALMEIPGFADILKEALPKSTFGTNESADLLGVLIGNSNVGSDKVGPWGILGLAMSLTHLQGMWGDAFKFELGQLHHDNKTGPPGSSSKGDKSASETIGMGVGILLGLILPKDMLDAMTQNPSSDYGFDSGFIKGSGVLQDRPDFTLRDLPPDFVQKLRDLGLLP